MIKGTSLKWQSVKMTQVSRVGIFFILPLLNALNVRNRYMSAVLVLNTMIILSVSTQRYKYSVGWFAHFFNAHVNLQYLTGIL